MKLKLAILSAFVLQGAQAAPSINLRVFGGLAHTSVKVEHDYPAEAAAPAAEANAEGAKKKGVEALAAEADALIADAQKAVKAVAKGEKVEEKAGEKATAKNEKSESALGATGGIAVDLSVQKEAMIFGLTAGMHYVAATPKVSAKFKAESEALAKFNAGFEAAETAYKAAEALENDAEGIKDAAVNTASKGLIEAAGGLFDAEALKGDDAAKAGHIYRTFTKKDGKHEKAAQDLLDKAAKDTKDAEWSVTAEHGPMYHIGVHGGMNFTDKLSAVLTVAPAFRNFKYEIKNADKATASETGIEVGVLGALRATYKLTDMFSVFGEVGYAMFFSEGKLASSKKSEKKEEKKDETKKEEAAKKENKEAPAGEAKATEAKATEGAEDASKAAAAHKIKTHVPGNVFFATAGVSIKLM